MDLTNNQPKLENFRVASIFKVPTRLPTSFLSPEGRKWLQQPNSTIEGTKLLYTWSQILLEAELGYSQRAKNPSKLRVWKWYYCIFLWVMFGRNRDNRGFKMGVFSHVEVAKILSLQSFFSNSQVESWCILYTCISICHEFFRDF